jgi:anthranilate phosphoribosyltransferase
MKKMLEQLLERNSLTAGQAEQLMTGLMEGRVPPAQISGLLVALQAKGESVSELLGFARAMRAKSVPVPLGLAGLTDTCGTGGDGSHSLNISTAVALVLAGAGVPVAKHGNRAVSGQTGSADLLEALGIKAAWSPGEVAAGLREASFAFLYAPSYHPAMKAVAPVRKELGIKTVFNMLGPLTNPCRPEYQLIGVYSLEKARLMAEALHRDSCNRALLVHSECGWDEAVPSCPFHLIQVDETGITEGKVDPIELGMKTCRLEDLAGGDPDYNARQVKNALQGQVGPLSEALALNAGLALYACRRAETIAEGIKAAKVILVSKKPWKVIEILRKVVPNG